MQVFFKKYFTHLINISKMKSKICFFIIFQIFAIYCSAQVGNGWAYGLPLQTGVNYRITNVQYVSNINLNKGAVPGYDWSPATKQSIATSRTISFTNQTQSEVSIQGSISVSSVLSVIESKLSAYAAMTRSRSIQDQTSATINIPAMKQVRPIYYEIRKGYTATLVVINVIGNATIASIKNKTMTLESYPITGSEYVDTYINYEWR
jgi:hypothetical protein